MRRLATLAVVACAGLLGVACGPDATPTPAAIPEGVLAGSVTIGPLCPVEPCGDGVPNPYASRTLLLYGDAPEPTRIGLREDGSFEVFTYSGTYRVELSDCEFLRCASALPVGVTVTPGGWTTLDIDIDTGIR